MLAWAISSYRGNCRMAQRPYNALHYPSGNISQFHRANFMARKVPRSYSTSQRWGKFITHCHWPHRRTSACRELRTDSVPRCANPNGKPQIIRRCPMHKKPPEERNTNVSPGDEVSSPTLPLPPPHEGHTLASLLNQIEGFVPNLTDPGPVPPEILRNIPIVAAKEPFDSSFHAQSPRTFWLPKSDN
jgi:hypothetical protein